MTSRDLRGMAVLGLMVAGIGACAASPPNGREDGTRSVSTPSSSSLAEPTAGATSSTSMAVAAAPPIADAALLSLLDLEPAAARQFRLKGRGPDFSPSVVRATYDKLPAELKKCSAAILSAQLDAMRSTVTHADKSFFNCADGESRAYLRTELKAFGNSVNAGRTDEATAHLGAAMAALHAFYAHTNFVELLSAAVPSWSKASESPIRVWSEDALPTIKENDLRSDYHESAFPKRCPPPPPQLDKSSKSSPKSKVVLFDGEITAHEAAVDLALQDSGAMLRSLWKQYPTYAQTCGNPEGDQNVVVGFLHALGDALFGKQ